MAQTSLVANHDAVNRIADGPPLRVLVIEDDRDLREVLVSSFGLAGIIAGSARDGAAGLALHRREHFDLLVLDVGLPGADGFEVATELRRGGDRTPVIFLTARDELRDKLAGFASGGDDYLTKPFNIAELIARIRAVVGRSTQTRSRHHSVGGLVLDEDRHEVTRDGEVIDLTPTEFRLLAFLMEHAGRVVTREQILRAVWDHPDGGNPSVVENYISFLRRKVDTGDPPLIRTVRGIGYSLRDG